MPKVKFSKITSVLLLIFSLFIVYGTILPFNLGGPGNVHKKIAQIQWIPFFNQDGSRTSISDLIQNIFLFVPIGFFGWLAVRRFRLKIHNSVLVLIYGAFLSFSVESLQLFTTDRTTSVTDIITNTFSTLLGILLAAAIRKSWAKARRQAPVNAIIHYPLFTPLLFLLFIICAYLLQPFDFALELKAFLFKTGHFLNNLFRPSFNFKDGPFTILLFSTLTYLVLQLVRHVNVKIPSWIVLSGLLMAGIFLESLQLIIRSRRPESADLLMQSAGIISGYLAFMLCLNGTFKPQKILISGFLFSVICYRFHPFVLSPVYRSFNWIPFISVDTNTMKSLSRLIETAIVFSFGGYICHKLCGNLSRKASFLPVVIVIISVMEILQGWIAGKNGDLTYVIAGFLMFLSGRFVCNNENRVLYEGSR